MPRPAACTKPKVGLKVASSQHGPCSQIEGLAEIVRKEWNLGYNPTPDLIGILEMRGVGGVTSFVI
ncbi:MAG: hypothetical protein ACYDC7_12500 [Acidithiobacillus ferrivorans]